MKATAPPSGPHALIRGFSSFFVKMVHRGVDVSMGQLEKMKYTCNLHNFRTNMRAMMRNYRFIDEEDN